MIIAFAGKAGAGKDSAAQVLINKGFEHRLFARPLKNIAANLLEIDYDLVNKIKDIPFGQPLLMNQDLFDRLLENLEGEGISVRHPGIQQAVRLIAYNKVFGSTRELLQFIGVELGRKIINDNIWVDTAMASLHESVVFTDLRFPNEAEALKNKGAKTVLIKRGNCAKIDASAHVSENALDGYKFDYVIENNGTIEELHNKVLEIAGE